MPAGSADHSVGILRAFAAIQPPRIKQQHSNIWLRWMPWKRVCCPLCRHLPPALHPAWHRRYCAETLAFEVQNMQTSVAAIWGDVRRLSDPAKGCADART